MKRNTIEVLVVGCAGSGKTALTRAINREPYDDNLKHSLNPKSVNPRPTANDPSPGIPLRVNDTEGAFAHRTDYSYNAIQKTTEAVIICFDSTDEDSFKRAQGIHQSITFNRPAMTNITLVGTMTDKRNNESFPLEQASQFAEEMKINFVTCSAKTGQGVELVFDSAKNQVLQSNAPKVKTAALTQVDKVKDAAKSSLFSAKKSVKSFQADQQHQTNEQQPQFEKSNIRTLEISLTNVKLTDEQKASVKDGTKFSGAYVMAQSEILKENNLSLDASGRKLDSGAEIFANTKRVGSDEKIIIVVNYSDANATATMKEVAGRISSVASQLHEPMEIRVSHDDNNLLASALSRNLLYAKQEVYRVNISNLREDLNKYGAPVLFYNADAAKTITQDNRTNELQSLQQSLVTADGKGVIIARANYLPPNPDDRTSVKLANEIHVELRPNAGQFLTSATVKQFRDELADMKRGGNLTVDPNNPAEFNDTLNQLATNQKTAPTAARQQAEKAEPLLEEKAVPLQLKKAEQRMSRHLPKDFERALQRQKSIGQIESFSPRENEQHDATADILTRAAYEFDKKVELTVESSNTINAASAATQFAHEQKADVQSISIDKNRTLLSDDHNDFLIDVKQDKKDPKTLHVTVDCRDTEAAENRANKVLSDFTASAAVKANRIEITRDDTTKVAESIQNKNPRIEMVQAPSAVPHK